jgi:histidyl-tRNA synthetase
VLGERDLAAGTVMVKRLDSGEQQAVPLADVVSAVRGLL